jgi:hypothetical protein
MDPFAALVEASKPTDGRCSEAPSQQMVDTRLPATGYKHGEQFGWLTFTPLMTGDTVTNITLPDASKTYDADGNAPTDIVVPLFPETKAAWKSQDLLSQPWLLVDSKQHWFKQLCDRAELSSSERCCFATYIKFGWLSSMEVEKRIEKRIASMVSIVDPASGLKPRAPPPMMITIAVDGFRVTYLKHVKFAVLLDTDVLRFIPGYLYAQALKFKASPPRSLGAQKVCWNKHKTRWDVYLSTGEQLSGPCVDGLSVDKSLPSEEFQAQKLSSKKMAVELWNNQDATNRARFPKSWRRKLSNVEVRVGQGQE